MKIICSLFTPKSTQALNLTYVLLICSSTKSLTEVTGSSSNLRGSEYWSKKFELGLNHQICIWYLIVRRRVLTGQWAKSLYTYLRVEQRMLAWFSLSHKARAVVTVWQYIDSVANMSIWALYEVVQLMNGYGARTVISSTFAINCHICFKSYSLPSDRALCSGNQSSLKRTA